MSDSLTVAQLAPQRRYHWQRQPLLASLAISLTLLLHYSVATMETPEEDALRYMDYAYSMAHQHTFGLSCGQLQHSVAPGNANAPLYPALLAVNSLIDPALKDNFACFIQATGRRGDCVMGTGLSPDPPTTAAAAQCPYHYRPVMAMQYAFAGISLLLVWLLASQILHSNRSAWLAMAAAYCAGLLTEFAGMLLTESLVIALFLLFQYRLLRWLQQPSRCRAAITGITLALLTLTRPEYWYLSIMSLALLWGAAWWRQTSLTTKQTLVATVMFFCLLSPWAARNHYHFGSAALTQGNYAEIILAQRLAYNEMTATEWLGAFVYWIPDFGDSLAKRMFPESWYWRHRDQPDAFRYLAIEQIASAVDNNQQGITAMLREEVFSQPLRHALVTLPLSWRGALIGDYWGLVGLFAYLCLLRQSLRAQQWWLAAISLPAWLLVFFHAAISINVPRYNLPLIGLYALGWGWLLQGLWQRWQARLAARGQPAT